MFKNQYVSYYYKSLVLTTCAKKNKKNKIINPNSFFRCTCLIYNIADNISPQCYTRSKVLKSNLKISTNSLFV